MAIEPFIDIQTDLQVAEEVFSRAFTIINTGNIPYNRELSAA